MANMALRRRITSKSLAKPTPVLHPRPFRLIHRNERQRMKIPQPRGIAKAHLKVQPLRLRGSSTNSQLSRQIPGNAHLQLMPACRRIHSIHRTPLMRKHPLHRYRKGRHPNKYPHPLRRFTLLDRQNHRVLLRHHRTIEPPIRNHPGGA